MTTLNDFSMLVSHTDTCTRVATALQNMLDDNIQYYPMSNTHRYTLTDYDVRLIINVLKSSSERVTDTIRMHVNSIK